MPFHAKKERKCFRPFCFPAELKAFLYKLSFKILSEVYKPELADRQSVEFTKLSNEVIKLVCRYYNSIIALECVQKLARKGGGGVGQMPLPGLLWRFTNSDNRSFIDSPFPFPLFHQKLTKKSNYFHPRMHWGFNFSSIEIAWFRSLLTWHPFWFPIPGSASCCSSSWTKRCKDYFV